MPLDQNPHLQSLNLKPARLQSLWNSVVAVFPTHTQSGSDAEYQALVVAAEHETEGLQENVEEADGQMGFQEQFEKTREGREGDAVAQIAAAISVGTYLLITWIITLTSGSSFHWFGWHPLFQSLALALFTYGILTLQPTSQPKTKAAGLTRHQLAMIILGFPTAFLGYAAIFLTKNLHGRSHFVSWHGKFGLITFCLLLLQILIGGGSVWFNGRLFGGNPKSKSLWKYHRAIGYAVFLSLLLTTHLGGAWSTWSKEHSGPITRVLAFTVAPATIVVAVYSRIRLSKMKFF